MIDISGYKLSVEYIRPRRQARLRALNGYRVTFKCRVCGDIKRIEKAEARVGRSADLVCTTCTYEAVMTHPPEWDGHRYRK